MKLKINCIYTEREKYERQGHWFEGMECSGHGLIALRSLPSVRYLHALSSHPLLYGHPETRGVQSVSLPVPFSHPSPGLSTTGGTSLFASANPPFAQAPGSAGYTQAPQEPKEGKVNERSTSYVPSTPWAQVTSLILTLIPCYVHSLEEETGGPRGWEVHLRSAGQGAQRWKSHA